VAQDHYRSIEGYMGFNWGTNGYQSTHFWTTVPHVLFPDNSCASQDGQNRSDWDSH